MANSFLIEFRIIIPFFNAEKFIGKCISSIKSQTFQNFKVYIFDDCSTDNSFEVAKSFIKDDERFFLKKNEENHGALYNIVQGLKVSFEDNSKVVDILVDGDDSLHNDDALSGKESWDLRSQNGDLVAPGLYLYTVESEDGNGDYISHISKFAIVR